MFSAQARSTPVIDSVRTRLTLWYVGVLAAVLIVFSGATYALLSRALHARVDDTLVALLDVAKVSLTHDAEEGQSVDDAARSTVRELSSSQQALAIYSSDLQPLAVRYVEDDIVPGLPEPSAIAGEAMFFTAREPDDDDAVRVAIARVQIAPERPYVIAVSQSLDATQDELASLRRIFYVTIPLGLLLAAIGGSLLARRTLSPVVLMADEARRIGGVLDRRLPVGNARDELGRLALTFNELLDRLAAAFGQQRQFMADASHELRTPLSAIRTAAGVTLARHEREAQEYRDALQIIDEQSRRLQRIVEDMFMLARVDHGAAPVAMREFYVDELLAEIVRAANTIGSRRQVTVELEADAEAPLVGDEELVRRMVTNLVDNALRHSPPGAAVKVTLSRDTTAYSIRVVDSGPGIPAAAQPRIFDRFFTTDAARSHGDEGRRGAGLGLAIARWIAEAHGGLLQLERSDDRGSTFLVTVPRRR
jgi:heavy metal sensor kinase